MVTAPIRAVALTILLGAAALGVAAPAASAADGELLPDLDQETPAQLRVAHTGTRVHQRWWLGFNSAMSNVGAGPLTIAGHRPDATAPAMVADQLITVPGADPEVVPGVGQLRFVRSPDHQHWHLMGFDRYELRRAGSTRAVVRDRKSGFCLGDRYRVPGGGLPGTPAQPAITGSCGLRETDLLEISEGISVGYGDIYRAYLEYQQLELTGLRAGRYVLVHTVDAGGLLRETTRSNNSASLLLDIRWRGGSPHVKQIRACPDTARCDRPVPKAPRVRTMAKGLEIPWDIAFMPDGGALVTERPGRVRLIAPGGKLRPEPVASVPVTTQGEGGLLGIVLDPDFAANRLVYLYFTSPAGMRLERWRWTGSELVPEATLVDAIAAGRVHDSGRIDFGPDGRLYVATGDAGQPELAQDPASLNGKFLALSPAQYHGWAAVSPEVVASGMRNPQGFDWDPSSGALVTNDHGPSGFDGPEGYDEVDLIMPGGNYGWPNAIGADTGAGRYLAPLRVYRRPIAPSGATFLHHQGSAWSGDYVLAALRGNQLRRLELRDGHVVGEHRMLRGRYGRLRTVREAPNGDLCVLTSNRDGRGTPASSDDRVLCVTPPPR